MSDTSTTKIPVGWEPYSQHTDAIGSAIVHIPTPNATHRDLLFRAGFNPDEWQIDGSVEVRQWMRYDQEWLYYYKFKTVAGESPEVVQEHIDDLVKHIRSRRKKIKPFVHDGNDAFAMFWSDWQIGKAEGGDGTEQTIERVLKSFDMAGDRIKQLRKIGRHMPELLIAGLGDIGEGTCGFYPGQQFLIDRTRREQGKISRELITQGLDYLTPMFDKTTVAVVGGNHGENRSGDGKRITSDGDNDDCAVFEAVQEAFDRAGHTNITWNIMQDELSMAVQAGGVPIGLTHGHLFMKGSTAQQKAYEWWKGQDFGFQAVRGTQVLVSSHFHFGSLVEHGSRTHIQVPAMDPGSKWFRDISGLSTPPGAMTARFDSTLLRGWDDLAILTPR
jgi:hypothetical protein